MHEVIHKLRSIGDARVARDIHKHYSIYDHYRGGARLTQNYGKSGERSERREKRRAEIEFI
jgi:hypothetical protein